MTHTSPARVESRASVRSLLLDLLAAVAAALVVSVLGWFAIQSVDWPAYGNSNVTRALATVAQVAAVVILTGCVWAFTVRRYVRVARVLSYLTIAGFTTATLALPLGGTRLYLGGISVDQQFRTEFLTRLTDSPALRDMTYADLPPFYSPGWFWLGGRFARIFGFDGWAAFQPWAIVSLAVASAVALALWFALVGPASAVAATLATVVAMLLYGSAEPYGAVVAVLLPPVLIFAWRAITRGDRAALAISAVYLGLAVWFYTLYLGVAAFTVIVMGLTVLAVRWLRDRRIDWRVPVRITIMGLAAIAIGLPAYAPYLWRLMHSSTAGRGSAFHFLPEQGSVVPLPMLHVNLLGLLALIGVVWILVRLRDNPAAQALGMGVTGLYLWALISMLVSAAGTTLLGFRTEPVLHVLLAAAGALGAVAMAGSLGVNYPRYRQVAVVLAALAAIGVAQTIPSQLAGEVAVAYSDTGGDGERGDRRPAGAESFYPQIDATISAGTGKPRTDTVVLTADYGFLAIYPYWGFQNLTSNYANPLAQFSARSTAIENWAELKTPDELIAALDTAPWRPPNAFVFRKSSDGLAVRLAEDVYPNDPNVRRYTVVFPEKLFADPRFTSTDVGPFVVVVRK